ncbi:ElyC/SanA/YdcF family protein [Colwelliaceae bacterium MEBiC 14330]
MDLFVLKKIITVFIMPINVVIILLLIALFLHKKKPKQSVKCLSGALAILVLCAFPPLSDSLMTSIENDFPSYVKNDNTVDYIVVLGCWHENNNALPVTSQLANCSLQRMVEALRIYQLHPEARIITSGYAGNNPISNAETVKQSLVLLGVPAQKIISEPFPKDTEEEAQLIAPRVLGSEVVLITNADHMPRAINYFQSQGVYPTAAPAGYWVKNPHASKHWSYYLPSAKKLYQSTVAWYESLGLIVQWFKSLIN